MDNLTHTLIGLALSRTRLGTRARFGTLALAVTANAPDLDIVPTVVTNGFRLLDHDLTYLSDHRGITHSVLGVAVQWLVWWAIFAWLERRPRRDGARVAPGPLCFAVLVGLASHPLLDSANVYGIRPWLPFDARWTYGDLLFIADPWLWLLLAAPCLLAGPRKRTWTIAFAAIAVAASVVLYAADPSHVPRLTRIVWPFAMLALALLRASRVGVARPVRVLWASAALTVAYLGLLYVARAQAERQGLARLALELAPGETIVSHATTPDSTRPLSWTLIASTGRRVAWTKVDLVHGIDDPRFVNSELDDPRVAAAIDTNAGRVWRAFARFPIASLEPDPHNAFVTDVVLRDARFFDQEWCEVRIPVGPASRPGR